MLKRLACLVLCSAISVAAQETPKTIALTDKSNVAAKDILKSLRKDCPNVSITSDATKNDYALEALETVQDQPNGRGLNTFTLTLYDHDGKTMRSSTSTDSLGGTGKDICHAIKTAVLVEVVDTLTLTQSQDTRGDATGGAVGAVVNGLTGRRTHTDSSTIYVIVKGEHALLDCYEHRTGCATIGPGKYYGEQDGDGIWLNYEVPIIHKAARNHYKIAGGW